MKTEIGVTVGLILLLTVMLLGAIAFSKTIPSESPDSIVSPEPTTGYIVTPTELQRQLVDMGYDIAIDGVPGTQTIQAWLRQVELQDNQQSYDRIGDKIKELEAK